MAMKMPASAAGRRVASFSVDSGRLAAAGADVGAAAAGALAVGALAAGGLVAGALVGFAGAVAAGAQPTSPATSNPRATSGRYIERAPLCGWAAARGAARRQPRPCNT